MEIKRKNYLTIILTVIKKLWSFFTSLTGLEMLIISSIERKKGSIKKKKKNLKTEIERFTKAFE